MEMEKRIQADMVSAMKAKETVRLASLRASRITSCNQGSNHAGKDS